MSEIVNPSILSGFMELLPEEQVQFNRLKEIVEEGFVEFGYLPIETPAIEKLEILLSKGGGETQKQIYKIEDKSINQALKYDLTVPLARYVAQYQYDLTFPFKRYQIDRVYRGERNQRGRYREFYQADIDIIGRENLSLINDAEIPYTMYKIFKKLNIGKFTFHVNNRKILNGYFEYLAIEDKDETMRILDKIEKIGYKNVREEFTEIGIDEDTQNKIFDLIKFDTNEDVLKRLKSLDVDNKTYIEGVKELELVYKYMKEFQIEEEYINLDISIARGLDYYTSTVIETFLDGHEDLGSVCSGGRYDNLASNFTKTKLPGIGLSIGLTRLFFTLKEANLINYMDDDFHYIKALIIPMNEEQMEYAIKVGNMLRNEGENIQIYYESGKMKKKFSYADKINCEYSIIIGSDEAKEEKVSLKNMKTGLQETVQLNELINMIK